MCSQLCLTPESVLFKPLSCAKVSPNRDILLCSLECQGGLCGVLLKGPLPRNVSPVTCNSACHFITKRPSFMLRHPSPGPPHKMQTQTGLKKLPYNSLKMVLPDDLSKVLDLLMPQFLHLYNGNSTCTWFMDCRTGETSDHVGKTGSVMLNKYNLLCSLTVFPSVLREKSVWAL